MALLIKNRSLMTKILRGKQIIFLSSSPKHGGTKARKLLLALGITDVDESFDGIMRVASEDEVQHTLATLQELDGRKESAREAIISICGVVSGLTHGVEIVGSTEESA